MTRAIPPSRIPPRSGAYATLPPVLSALRDELGPETMRRVLRHLGGQTFYLPLGITPTSSLTRRIGVEAHRWLQIYYGDRRQVSFPLGPRSTRSRRALKIRQMIVDGADTHAIVRRFGCSARTVIVHRRKLATELAMTTTRKIDEE